MVLNQAQGLKEKSHEVSARKNNNRLIYNEKCRGGRIPPPPALLGLKEPSPIFSTFFFKFLVILVSQKAHIFLLTHVKCHSWKAFRLEDINEKVSGYCNHN